MIRFAHGHYRCNIGPVSEPTLASIHWREVVRTVLQGAAEEVSGHWQNQKEELAIGSINEMAVQTWSDFVAAGGVSTVHGLETVATWLTGGVRKET